MLIQQRHNYWCFISYRHADNQDIGRMWASWLHQKLENYEVPADLVGQSNGRGDTIPERIFPVFRDEDELPANADLASPIYTALDHSKLLLVLCSPRARQSLYVNNEILYFKKIGKSDRILAALIDGVPNSSWNHGDETRECFPQALMHPVDEQGQLILSERAEPIAADFRLRDTSEGWTSPEALRQQLEAQHLPKNEIQHIVAEYQKSSDLAFLKIVAGVLGIPLGLLTDRDAKYQLEKAKRRATVLRRFALSMGALALLAMVGGATAWLQWRQAENAKQVANQEKAKAVESENRALVNLETAKDEQYTSGIRFAREALVSKRFDLARQTLISLPSDRRALEWGMFLEWAGPPSWQFDSTIDPSEHYAGSPAVKTELTRMWRDLQRKEKMEDDGSATQVALSPDQNVAALYDEYRGRHPTTLQLYRVGFGQPIMTLLTENYGGIMGATFSQDGSLMMVSMTSIRGLLPQQLGPIPTPRERTEENEDEDLRPSLYYIIAVPKIVTLGIADGKVSNADELYEYSWDNKPPANLDLQAKAWNQYGVVVEGYNGDGDNSYSVSTEVPWDLSTKNVQPIKKTSEHSAEEEGFHASGNLCLPLPWRRNASAIARQYDGKPVGLSTVWEDPQGRVLAMFHVINGGFGAEIWDLVTQKKIIRLGEGMRYGENDGEGIFSMGVWGGAFSPDGKYAIVALVKSPQAQADVDEESEGAIAIFRLNDGTIQSYLEKPLIYASGRFLRVHFSFSTDAKQVVYSIMDGAGPSNTISVFDVATGKELPDEGGELSYYGWTPDGKHIATLALDADALQFTSTAEPSVKSYLQGVVQPITGPAFDDLQLSYHPTQQRFRIGRFLFKTNESNPLVDTDFLAATADLNRWVVRSGESELVILRGAFAESLRKQNPNGLNTAELMLYDSLIHPSP